MAAAAGVAREFAADVVHGHLLFREDAVRLAETGVPLLLTIHNVARPDWPRGIASLQCREAALLAACSQAVEADLRAASISLPARTVWNGIDLGPLEITSALKKAADRWRRQEGISRGDFVLLALANPRPQKRLDRLPAVLAATQAEFARRGIGRLPRLVVAGEPSRVDLSAAQAETELREAVSRSGQVERIHLLGNVPDVAPLLAGADALVSVSLFEGLSLAHLEALAAGLPVVATAAGGTVEIAHENPAMRVLPLDASPQKSPRCWPNWPSRVLQAACMPCSRTSVATAWPKGTAACIRA